MIDAGGARGLAPAADTAEGAVVLFLASRIRGDRAWEDAIVADPGRKAKKALKTWRGWTLRRAQLKSRKMRGQTRGYVRVWLDLSIDGDSETGTDDFTVTFENGAWRVSDIPS